ncbi:caveolin 1 [Mytilus galloprovincialis]|uniref:Caveolin n=1 Tax=Mytilus galloprovincialis TaxID=29158 RepID=A0A8B6EIR0_MYTGA|nr:caveolin 1 [Mytilus galloprovincialis]
MKTIGSEIDLVERDPNGINAHLGTLHFNDVFGEPDGVHSIDCVWKLSAKCFDCWKLLCYNILTIFYGVCIAAEWGCEFAVIAFYHIWIISPCMKIFEINCGICQRIYSTCVNCCIVPWCEAFGSLFSAFKK